ncbi:MAG: hypothetical protein LQ339_000238 [Xanthoria mediterranea]|nr:MAG: hypothetical protein LQ339_000238 [Xanthoria mediterranea]
MSSLEEVLAIVRKEFEVVRPMLPTYLHLLVSALLPIYAGAHASLTRPSSAAKPAKSKKKTLRGIAAQDDLEDEVESQIEGLAASDAIWLPLLAGCTLGGLYVIIKWLEDPALLNKVLNWYFAIFGVYGVAKMFKDTIENIVECVFPARYIYASKVWVFDGVKRIAVSETDPLHKRQSPLSGRLSLLPLPVSFSRFLWSLRQPHSTLCIRTNLYRRGKAHFHVVPSTIISGTLAISIMLYYNIVSRPWYLTNILGFAFAYNALQLISPSTSWTGTLILGSLFLYDIYFVFYTPLMVTVATQLDIPAKLLFPRPSSPDSTKPQLSMLGLGDVVLPGMMIGFALRLDLYMHYLRKQTTKSLLTHASSSTSSEEKSQAALKSATAESSSREASDSTSNDSASPVPSTQDVLTSPSADAPAPSAGESQTIKSKFDPATGNWGNRFWTSSSDPAIQGVVFPKPYFHTSLFGYFVGIIMTLGIMQVTGHAQPALFYLVPCVLGAFWGRAFVRGEVKEVWRFDEGQEKAEDAAKEEAKAKAKKEKAEEKAETEKKQKEESKQGNEKVKSDPDAKKDQTDQKKAKKDSKPRKATVVQDSDFFQMSLNIGYSRSKGLKHYRLARNPTSKSRAKKRDTPKQRLLSPGADGEGPATDAQETDLSRTDSSKTDSFELLAIEEASEGDGRA